MPFTAEQQRERRVKLKANGICIMCHSNNAVKGKALCQECAKKTREYRNEKRKDVTLCLNCQNKLDEFAILRGGRYCGYCSERRKLNRYRGKH